MSRDQSFQVFRGVAIVAVVTIHAISANSAEGFEMGLALVLRQFINFAVPMFLFISGYFSAKTFDKRSDYFLFLQKRLVRVLIPYIIWSIAGIVLLKGLNGLSLPNLAVLILTGQSVSPYYYIIVLVQLILITPLLVKSLDNKFLNALVFSLSFISLLILYWINIFHSEISFPWYALPCLVWILFYYWGIYARVKLDDNWFYKRLPIAIACLLLCLAASVIEAEYIYKSFGSASFATSQIKISSFATSFCFINILMGLRPIGITSQPMSLLGEFSFGIYLAHMFFLPMTVAFCRKIPLIQNFSIGLIVAATLQTIALCLALALVSRKLLGEKTSVKFLGM